MATCKKCSQPFTIHPDEEAFLQKIGFMYGGKTVHPPKPVYCPDCRSQIRTSHRNEQNLYKVRSSFSGKDIIGLYAEESVDGKEPLKIFSQEEWRSDAWDPMEFGRQFDFKRSFFEQFAELQRAVPRMALISIGNENSGFTTGTGYCKNCYLINSSENCEECYYGKLLQKCKSSVDCSYLYDSELCYECFSVYSSYNCQYLSFSQNCTDCLFSSNLKSCKNCCLCTNLDHKEYHFMNQPLSKEEYAKRVETFHGSYQRTQDMRKLSREAMTKMVRKYANIVNGDNCTGDYIENSRNCLDCYDVTDSEDCRYVCVGVNVKDNYDCSNMYLKPELCYDTLGTIEVYNAAYCLFVFHSQRLLYCDYCFNCSDCFGCTGLTRKKFCIFNTQYTQEEYENLVPKIIAHMEKLGEWGLYFPPKYALFGYNETLAEEYFPLTKEEAKKQGFHWRDSDDKQYRPQTVTLPDHIKDVEESITQEMLACETCKKNYRIIPQELNFYKTMTVPVPHTCPECRHRTRMQLRNPRKLWERTCMSCNKALQTSYAPDRPETIYCETCYLKHVY
ncbi:MAG: hypothetical protein Q7R81_05750 [Candidatus Peregrinibacteria bacterium]|nr:hypothetical protein [Candidatus Peregrinibacteria bacterium]